MAQIRSAKDLVVYHKSYELAMEIFEISKRFPADERSWVDKSNTTFVAIGFHESA